METLKNLAEKHSGKLKYLFICGAVIGLINTFCRADYNFILYIVMFYIWKFLDQKTQSSEKVTFFYILLYSGLIDIIWCFFWNNKWDLLKEDFESGTHGLVIFLSWIGILLKAIIVIMIFFTEWNSIKASLPKSLSEKLNIGYKPQIDDNQQI